MTIKGVLWHSTGAANPTLKRYVQPSSDDANYDKLIKLLGKNTNGNDWNHISHSAGLNCWIGQLADGTVTTVQTMPWNYRPWGCGSGSKGSCNDGWIQFEICEPTALTDATYFNKVYTEACEITAYLCKLYNIDPKGTATVNGVKVPTILCHQDSYKLGLGTNHSDVYNWFNKHGKTMDDARSDVAKLMGVSTSENKDSSSSGTSSSEVTVNYTVTVSSSSNLNCRKGPGTNFAIVTSYPKGTKLTITKENNGWGYTGKGWVSLSYVTKVVTSSSYQVRVTASSLNIRKGPGTSYAITGVIKDKGTYTITKTSGGWGYLRSGAGWINLSYTKKV
jgi:uncharacterized protein YraI